MINYEVALGQFELFVLILIRLASFVYAAPFFNTANVPRKFKVGFAIDDTKTVFYGLCNDCRQIKPTNESNYQSEQPKNSKL